MRLTYCMYEVYNMVTLLWPWLLTFQLVSVLGMLNFISNSEDTKTILSSAMVHLMSGLWGLVTLTSDPEMSIVIKSSLSTNNLCTLYIISVISPNARQKGKNKLWRWPLRLTAIRVLHTSIQSEVCLSLGSSYVSLVNLTLVFWLFKFFAIHCFMASTFPQSLNINHYSWRALMPGDLNYDHMTSESLHNIISNLRFLSTNCVLNMSWIITHDATQMCITMTLTSLYWPK